MNSPEKISVILPIYNEAESLPILHEHLVRVMEQHCYNYEIIYIDDGSDDRSAAVIKELLLGQGQGLAIVFRRNFGQSAATAAGIEYATGTIVIVMDSDLQNDPADIPKLIERIEAGADIVTGWRKQRQDNLLLRTFPSRVANRLISWISGLDIHDLGCSLKAYRREIIKSVKLYGETHRFIAIYANMIGGKIEEVEVTHHPRQFGKSKYGLKRIAKVLLDLVILKYMLSYATRPIYFFGKIAFLFFLLGTCSFGGLLIHKLVYGTSFVRSPFLLLTPVIFFVGVQSILTGVLAEILMRIYHETQHKPVYHIREIADFSSNNDKTKISERDSYGA